MTTVWRTWTAEEDEAIAAGCAARASPVALARRIGRSAAAVVQRAVRLRRDARAARDSGQPYDDRVISGGLGRFRGPPRAKRPPAAAGPKPVARGTWLLATSAPWGPATTRGRGVLR